MPMSRNNQRKFNSKWIICGLGALFLVFVLLHFSQNIDAQNSPARTTANPGSFSRLVKKASPSVVNISTVRIIKATEQPPFPFGSEDPLKEFFEKFFREQMPREFKQNSVGTGLIIDKDGHILTNNHVVEQTTEIKVSIRPYFLKPAAALESDLPFR